MGSILPLAIWRTTAGKAALAVLALGIFTSAVLLASAPIYARAMADLGLTYVIRTDLQGHNSSRIEFNDVPLQTAEGLDLRNVVERRIDERLGWFRASESRYLRLGRFFIGKPGEAPRKGLPLGQPASLTGYEEHVRVLSGVLPSAVPDGSLVEVAMTQRGAQVAGLEPGDAFELREEFDNCERVLPRDLFAPPPPPCPVTASVSYTLSARLTAIIEPVDAEDPFWVGGISEYFDPYSLPIENAGLILPMFAAEPTLLQGVGSRLPGYRVHAAWHVFAKPEVLTRTNYARARDDIDALYRDFEPHGGVAFSPLRDTLQEFRRSADYQQAPLTILLLEITGIALFYVIIVAAIVVERQAAEIALLRGRGASFLQVMWLYLFQGLVIGIPAMLAAPFIAGGLTALLGLTPAFHNVSDGELLPVTLVPASFALGAAGAGLSIVALLIPAALAAAKGALATRRAESRPGSSFFQRYYLDLALAGAAILLLVELNQRGSVFKPSATGGVSSDPLLLASPALVIAAAAALILRFYPLVFRLIAKGVAAAAGPAATLGLWQVVRNAGQYTRLALLLMMAVAVGTFAASYTSTADRSYADRANYEAGTDLRAFAHNTAPAYTNERSNLEKFVGKLDGVARATSVVRTKGGVAGPGNTLQQFQVLALDPRAASDMLWFRDDFSGPSLEGLLSPIDGLPALPGKTLPGSPVSLSGWIRAEEQLQNVSLRAGLRDASGRFFNAEIGALEAADAGEWVHLTGTLDKVNLFYEPVYPLTLVSLYVRGSPARPTADGPSISLDDITSADASGAVSPIEDFEGPSQWAVFPSAQAATDTFATGGNNPHGGKAVGRFTLRPGQSSETRGIYLAGFLTPLPAVVSNSFLAATGATVGATVLLSIDGDTLLPIQVRATFEFFPTAPREDGPVVLLNRDRFLAWTAMEVAGLGTLAEPAEVWATLAPGADLAKLTKTLKSRPYGLDVVVTRADELDRNTSNPLVAASGTGILGAAFIAVLILVCVALLASLIAAARRRRVEFAVVRALGLNHGQILGMLALEYAIVFVIGVGAGCGLGLFVSGRLLSFLDVTESGQRVEPPFILETRWVFVAAGVGVLLLLFAAGLLLTTRSVTRTPSAEALRTE